MKRLSLLSLLAFSLFGAAVASAVEGEQAEDLRMNEEFVATCPEEFLTYLDRSEGGPGAFCACPDESVSYLDKAEGGPGFYCAK